MAIRAVFSYAGENIQVIIDGTNLMFMDDNGTITSIEGLRLDRNGVMKEFPELKDNEDWRKIAMERLKDKVKSLKTELERVYYVKDELVKFGYEELFFQRAGWRNERFK